MIQVIETARNLADYIKSLEEIKLMSKKSEYDCTHMGAIFTDIILQAGLNYKTVVFPRVQSVKLRFPNAYNIENLTHTLKYYSLEEFLNWSHPIKLERFENLMWFCTDKGINSTNDLIDYLKNESNREDFLSQKGIGLKTLDYLMKLLNFDTIAVDRHIVGFLESAGINHMNYASTKKTFEFAADLLDMSRASLDATVWNYMSSKNKLVKNNSQLAFQF